MSDDHKPAETPTGLRRAIKSLTDSDYARDKKAILAWIGATFGGVALVIAGWAHGKLSGHETSIAVQASEINALKDGVKEQAATNQRTEVLLRDILTRLPRTP
jgi:hypothetical protein